MANKKLVTTHSVTPGNTPGAGTLKKGELAINIPDKKIWAGDAAGDPQLIGGDASEFTPLTEDTTITVGPTGQFTSISDAFAHVMKVTIGQEGVDADYGGGLRSPRWIIQLEAGDVELLAEEFGECRVAGMNVGIEIIGDATSKSSIVNTYSPGFGTMHFVHCVEVRLGANISKIQTGVTFANTFGLINMDAGAWIESIYVHRSSYVEANGSTLSAADLYVGHNGFFGCYPILTLDNSHPDSARDHGAFSVVELAKAYFRSDLILQDLKYTMTVVQRSTLLIDGNLTLETTGTPTNNSGALGLDSTAQIVVEGTITNNTGYPDAAFPINQIQPHGGYATDGTESMVVKPLTESVTLNVGPTSEFTTLDQAFVEIMKQRYVSGHIENPYGSDIGNKAPVYIIQLEAGNVLIHESTTEYYARLDLCDAYVEILGDPTSGSSLVSNVPDPGVSIVMFHACQHVRIKDVSYIDSLAVSNTLLIINATANVQNLNIGRELSVKNQSLIRSNPHITCSNVVAQYRSTLALQKLTVDATVGAKGTIHGVSLYDSSTLEVSNNFVFKLTSTAQPYHKIYVTDGAKLLANGVNPTVLESAVGDAVPMEITSGGRAIFTSGITNTAGFTTLANIPPNTIRSDRTELWYANGPAPAAAPIAASITRTVGTGKDFELFHDAMTWVMGVTTAGDGAIVLDLDDGTHLCGTGTPRENRNINAHYVIQNCDVYIRSTSGNKANCIIAHHPTDDGNYSGLFGVKNGELHLADVTLNATAGGYPGSQFILGVDCQSNGIVTASQCDFKDFWSAIYLLSGSFADVGNSVLDGNGTGVSLSSSCSAAIFNTTISNNGSGINVDSSGANSFAAPSFARLFNVTFTANTNDVTDVVGAAMPLNQIQYDGCYVTNGAAALSFKP